MIKPTLRCTFDHEVVTFDDLEYVLVIDHDIGASVSNDAHAAVRHLSGVLDGLGGRPVIYRDTTGLWDVLAHDGHEFVGFYSVGAATPQAAIELIPTPDPDHLGYGGRRS